MRMKMSDIWGEFWGPNAVFKKVQEKHGQEMAEAAVYRELQLHLDELTFEQLEAHIELMKEDIEIENEETNEDENKS